MIHDSMPASAESAPLRIQMLGAFRIARGDRVVSEGDWKLQKASSLVKLLALTSHHALHREQVCDLLWPDLPFEAAYNNVRYALHIARQALATMADGSPLLVLRRQMLALDPTYPLEIDVEAFEAAATTARLHRDPIAYQDAIARYTGDLLPEDHYEDWATARRESAREQYRALLMECADLHAARQEHEAAIALLQRAVACEPTDEAAHVGLMGLYARSGRRAQALAQYARLHAALREELDVTPAAATERLYADIIAGRLATVDAPPTEALPTAPHDRHNLPALLTRFIGRERERATVGRLLGESRLLTLMGTGGCGKTRLAIAAAEDCVTASLDGVWMVELAALSDPALVPQAVMDALGLHEEVGRSHVQTLVEALRPKRLLLVLDNCEHLIAVCAALVEALLRACPHLRLLTTSREALRIPGEVTWRVPSLPVPDEADAHSPAALAANETVRLFVDRVRWRQPDFALTEANADAVAAICRRLDGVPLAVELAAARTAVLSPAQVAARLDDALRLLTDGGRTAPPRQRALRAALDWSHALLGDDERVVFRRLAIFAGGCTVEAAESVCAGEGIAREDVLTLLALLADKSLVLVEAGSGEARYRLLETVRQYARERLEASGERDAVWQRHADYYGSVAAHAEEALRGPDQAEWLHRLETEHDNFRAALGWLVAKGEIGRGLRIGNSLAQFWATRGYWNEGGTWLETLLSHGRAERTATWDSTDWMLALFHAGRLARNRGESAPARARFEELRINARANGNDVHYADALTQLGRIASDDGADDTARALLTEGLAIRRTLGNERDIAISLRFLGEIAMREGDLAEADVLFDESAALCRRLRDTNELATVLCLLGHRAMERAEFSHARVLFAESALLFQQLNSKPGIVKAIAGFAILAAAEGHAARFLHLAGSADAASAAMSFVLDNILHEQIIAALATARQSLGDAAADAAWAMGHTLSLEQAIAEASQPDTRT